MNKKIFWIICLIIFIGVLIFINNYLVGRNSNSVNVVDKAEHNSEEIKNVLSDSSSKVNESYDKSKTTDNIIQITSSNFDELVLNSEKTVLVDFYADWCPSCKMLAPIIEEVASENKDENLTFVRVNVDDESYLSSKYGIQSIPTLVLIKNGEEIDRIVGYIDKVNLEEFIRQ